MRRNHTVRGRTNGHPVIEGLPNRRPHNTMLENHRPEGSQ